MDGNEGGYEGVLGFKFKDDWERKHDRVGAAITTECEGGDAIAQKKIRNWKKKNKKK